jgi:uncharacterized lipoprotein YmbA
VANKSIALLCLHLFLASAVSSCHTSAPSRLYSLESIEESDGAMPGSFHIVLGPWQLPEYLNRPQIVTRTSSAELEAAGFHRWAEPIDDGFGRVLAMNLSTLLQSSSVYEMPSDRHNPEGDFVSGRIYRFDVDDTGAAVLDLIWAVHDKDRQLLHGPVRSVYEEQSTSPSDHDAGVQALSRTVGSFSREIAEVVSTLPR